MATQDQDQYIIWGTTNKGVRTETVQGFTSDWNAVRDKYVKDFPNVVFVRMEAAIPEQAALAVIEIDPRMHEQTK